MNASYDPQIEGIIALMGRSLSAIDSEYAEHVKYKINSLGVFPFSVTGILLNCLTMWIWTMESGYYPTSHLFKAQAACDLLFMGFFLPMFILHRLYGLDVRYLVISTLSLGNKRLGINITMLIAVVRWVGMRYPLTAHKLLSRFRINCVLAGLLLWVMSIQSLAVSQIHLYGKPNLYINVFRSVVCVFFPALIQISLMIVVLHRLKTTLPISALTRDRDNIALVIKMRERRIEYAVFSMCLMTFVVFVLIIFVQMVHESTPSLRPQRLIPMAFQTLMAVFNSIFNFFIYLCFVFRFRELVGKRLARLCPKLWVHRSPKGSPFEETGVIAFTLPPTHQSSGPSVPAARSRDTPL